MKAKLSRLFFGALMFVTMCATAPALHASAEETVRVIHQGEDGSYYFTNETVEEVQKDSFAEAEQLLMEQRLQKEEEISKEKAKVEFSTFAELKEIINNAGNEYTTAIYTGTEPLVIEESITMPANMDLQAPNAEVIIPKDVKVTALTYDNGFGANKLVVKGTIELTGAYLYVYESLNVEGKIVNGGYIYLFSGATASGTENIEYVTENNCLLWYREACNTAELKEVIAVANKNINQANWQYSVDLVGNSQEPVIINESVVVPANVALNFWSQTIIETGCTVELNRSSYVYYPLTVKGTLVNNVYLTVYHEVDWNPNYQGKMIIAEGGTYTGKGYLTVYCFEDTDYKDIVPGLNWDNFEAKEYSYGTTHYWTIRNVEGLIKLGTPSELAWHREFLRVWDPETQSYQLEPKELIGAISWKPVAPDQGQYLIQIYKEGETIPYQSHGWDMGSTSQLPEYYGIDSFLNDDPESGTYYFTVTSRGDGTQYRDSETAVSDTWTYTKPSAQIGKCRNLSMNWPYVTFEAPADDTYVDGFYIDVWYSTTLDGEKRSWSGTWFRNYNSGQDYITSSFYTNNAPAGYYYVRVRALSNDITKACNGEWSDWSEPYCLTDIIEEVNNELDDIIENTEDPDDIREAVQNMDTEELKAAMEADQSDSDTVAKIEELEAKVGGAAAVNVTEDAAAFGEGGVSVVGANLNNSASETDPITLVIDKPEKDNVIPEAYDNSVAVRFNMTLDNVEDPENLAVPVKITMPIPATINPQFLVVLHYHAATDEVEEIRPHVYREGSQYYASFVLTSFSDFAMTQEDVNPFSDVPEDQWYYPYVKKAWKNGLMSGVSTTEDGLVVFAPENLMTRAMFVQVLYGIHGKPAVEYTAKFEDVPSGQWYTSAVLWAAENGITSGVSATNFGVNQDITREQMALMLMKYAQLIGADVSGRANMDGFVDWESVSSWAKDAMQWAVENGVMSGEAGGKLNPQGKANRAVGATMFNAFYEKFIK